MDALAVTFSAVVASALALVWLVPAIAVRARRPRFLLALVIGGIGVAAYQASISCPARTAGYLWPGVVIDGGAARAVAFVHASVCAAGAWGLWRMRRWARMLAMAYLGALIASFLLWGLRGGDENLAAIMAWQMFVLPLLTFGFMYLQRGDKYFRAR